MGIILWQDFQLYRYNLFCWTKQEYHAKLSDLTQLANVCPTKSKTFFFFDNFTDYLKNLPCFTVAKIKLI